MDSNENDNRHANFGIILTVLLAVWVFGGAAVLAFATKKWDALSFTAKGHWMTIWFMVVFLLIALHYLSAALRSQLRGVAVVIVILLVALEAMLASSYSSW